jgi:hypothetical protein
MRSPPCGGPFGQAPYRSVGDASTGQAANSGVFRERY